MSGVIANAVVFQVGWWIAVLGAGWAYHWIGPLLVACLVCVNVCSSAHPHATARIVIVVGLSGSLLDSVLSFAGLLLFIENPFAPWLCPPWLIALWCLFATTLNGSLRWLAGRDRPAALVGGICGPLSYYAGQQLGALRLGHHEIRSLMLLSILWAVLLPLLMHWVVGRKSADQSAAR
ncbi:MAG: DUF2878 domain-containing protein [Nitrospira sp.]|nr:DUF2878 domain-containing protein [Nitrospira sp.]